MDRPSSHSQKVPYARKEGRKSLFSKMKDSMRDMLSPSWLSDLVHNVKKDSPVAADRNSPMSSDQASGMQPAPPGMQDSPQLLSPILPPGTGGMTSSDAQQPGSLKSRGSFLGNGQPRTLEFAELGQGVNPNDPMVSAFQQGNFPPPISEFTSAQLPLARLTEKSDSIMAQEDTMSQRSDGSKSTSGCSSMVPQTEVPRQDIGGDKRKAPEQGHYGSTSPQEQQAAKRQRLHAGAAGNQTFSRRLSDTFINKSSSVSHKPAFNTTLFGSPFTNESSLLGTSLHESSFYPGKTKFGGRSSLSFRSQKKSVDLNQSLPGRLSVPVKAFMKAKPRLNPNKEAVTSSTAKRILEALDKMPTPLNDAKKIPMVPRQWTESPSFFSRDRPAARIGPPTQKLNVSSQISISKNRQVSFAPVGQPKPSTSQVQEEAVTRPTRQDTVVLNTETAGSGKMRREKSYHRGSASVKTTLEEQDTVILPALQTNFTLPVSSMPKFSFGAPVSQPTSGEPISKPKSEEPVLQMGLKEQVKDSGKSATESPVKQSLKFTFSSPIIEPVPSNKPASPQKFGAFQFSSPISVDKKNEVSMEDSSKPFIATTFNPTTSTTAFSFSSPANKFNTDYSFSTAPKPKPKINGPTESTGGGFAVASELKQGSVMDILGGGSLKKFSTPNTQSVGPLTGSAGTETSKAPPLSTLFKQSGWNCDVCLINNKDDVNKCVACQTPKPCGQKSEDMTNTATTTSEPAKTDLFAKFQAPSGTWSCDVCLLQNKPDASKCVACQTQKPASKASSTSEPAKTDVFAKFQTPSGTWTCDVCLLQNKPELSKCVACQSQKPGAASSGSFPKIGSIQPGNWICSKCLIQNKQSDSVCGACKTAKSTSKPSETEKSDSLFEKLKPAAGTWECEMCLVQNMKDAKTCVACQTPKPLKFFKHPPGDWTCDTCLVSNKETAVNCVACNYARPGPPRTQAVPSIAKSYTLSQTPGFSIPTTSESTSISQSSTGGFKFSPASVAGSTTSGFNVSKLNEDAKKSSETKTSFGGFKFNTEAPSTTSSSGFKFGAIVSSESDKSGENAGGFKVNAVVPSTDKQSAGFKFGGSDSKSENTEGPIKSAGFQFGKSDSSLASVSSSVSNNQSSEGFSFGQKTDQSALNNSSTAGLSFGQKVDQVQTTTSVPGGFSFKPVDSLGSVKSSGTESTKTVTNSISIGGFNFSTVTSSTGSVTATSSNSIGQFTFTATKATDPNIMSGTTKSSEAPASTIGGFSFGQKSAESNTSNQPFSFAQNTASVSSPNKRGRDDDTGEPEVKKASFSFGQTANSNSSLPFQFGANNAVATTSSSSSTVFAFGQKPTTSSSTSLFTFGQQNSTPVSSTGSSLFGIQNSTPASSTVPSVFGQQNVPVTTTSSISSTFAFGGQKAPESSGSTLPVFGQANSITTTTAAPSLFQFGQTNNTASVAPTFNPSAQTSGQTSVFGSTPSFNFTVQKTETTTAASTAGLFKFGATQPAPATTPTFGSASAFGSSSTPAFGTGSGASGAFSGNAPSTTPAFGSTPPAFGSSNTNSGQSAPLFGGVFGNPSQPAAPTQSNQAVFQFGAKPAESTQAAPSTGYNFAASVNPAGLSAGTNFNFSASQAPVNAFSATGPSTPGDGRIIKKATRRIKR